MEFINKILGRNNTSNSRYAILEVQKKNLTYLNRGALIDLHEAISLIEKKRIIGEIIETGCALGGSSIVIAKAKNQNRAFYIYDVFGMIPSPGEKDGEDVLERYNAIKQGKSVGINGEKYYGYQKNLFEQVKSNFQEFNIEVGENNIHLVKGLYQDTLKVNYKVAFAHIDCDWYDSVMVCLKQIEPNLSKGGILVIDDYYFWSGCAKAVDDYFSDKRKEFKFERKNRLHIIKK